ncbi:MAG: dihydrodipicolinate synthase family protein [Anaerolineae bacterium]
MITPHHEDGSIDKEGFVGVVDFLIENGIACIITGGSTGECYAQNATHALSIDRPDETLD